MDINQLINLNISAERYFILETVMKKQNKQLKEYLEEVSKISKLNIQYLIRKNYLIGKITDIENLQITDKALDLLGNKKQKININEKFNEFWELFPSTDKFKTFPRTRTLRSAKSKCKQKYEKALKKNEYTHEDIIKALNYEINQRKKSSNRRENKFKFMKNSLTWLNQEHYIVLLEEMTELNIESADSVTEDDFTQEFK